jgi:hypothetical protein
MQEKIDLASISLLKEHFFLRSLQKILTEYLLLNLPETKGGPAYHYEQDEWWYILKEFLLKSVIRLLQQSRG